MVNDGERQYGGTAELVGDDESPKISVAKEEDGAPSFPRFPVFIRYVGGTRPPQFELFMGVHAGDEKRTGMHCIENNNDGG